MAASTYLKILLSFLYSYSYEVVSLYSDGFFDNILDMYTPMVLCKSMVYDVVNQVTSDAVPKVLSAIRKLKINFV